MSDLYTERNLTNDLSELLAMVTKISAQVSLPAGEYDVSSRVYIDCLHRDKSGQFNDKSPDDVNTLYDIAALRQDVIRDQFFAIQDVCRQLRDDIIDFFDYGNSDDYDNSGNKIPSADDYDTVLERVLAPQESYDDQEVYDESSDEESDDGYDEDSDEAYDESEQDEESQPDDDTDKDNDGSDSEEDTTVHAEETSSADNADSSDADK